MNSQRKERERKRVNPDRKTGPIPIPQMAFYV